jgi:hypothetical protein
VQHEQQRTPDSLPSFLNFAAHAALQTRDRTKLSRQTTRSLWRSRISGTPLRARRLAR